MVPWIRVQLGHLDAMMSYLLVFLGGCMMGVAIMLAIFLVISRMPGEPSHRSPRSIPDVKRGTRPDIRRVVLRPVNADQPPSRVTQALFRQRPTRKLKEDDGTDRSR